MPSASSRYGAFFNYMGLNNQASLGGWDQSRHGLTLESHGRQAQPALKAVAPAPAPEQPSPQARAAAIDGTQDLPSSAEPRRSSDLPPPSVPEPQTSTVVAAASTHHPQQRQYEDEERQSRQHEHACSPPPSYVSKAAEGSSSRGSLVQQPHKKNEETLPPPPRPYSLPELSRTPSRSPSRATYRQSSARHQPPARRHSKNRPWESVHSPQRSGFEGQRARRQPQLLGQHDDRSVFSVTTDASVCDACLHVVCSEEPVFPSTMGSAWARRQPSAR